MSRDMPDVLKKICHTKREEIRQLHRHPAEDFYDQIEEQSGPRGFRSSLRHRDDVALIAEIKKASPSAGIIRETFDPIDLARSYEAGGARCLSVLTDEQYFQGALSYLQKVRSSVNLPVLRKDFLLDAIQILEARAAGADCVLLIVAALGRDEMADLLELTQELGMDALIEVHDEAELDTALSIGANLLGINNRDLRTFDVDLQTTINLLPKVPDDVVCVAESGIKTRDDVLRMKEHGVDAILVGGTLMRAGDVEKATAELSDV